MYEQTNPLLKSETFSITTILFIENVLFTSFLTLDVVEHSIEILVPIYYRKLGWLTRLGS